MPIIRRLKILGYSSYDAFTRAVNSVQKFGTACGKLADAIAERYGCVHSVPQDAFGKDGIQYGYDYTRPQTGNVKAMAQRKEGTGHMGQAFLHAGKITDCTSGDLSLIAVTRHKERLMYITKMGVLAALFAKPLFPRRFGNISQQEGETWLTGIIERIWTLTT